jgi:hypothetical protein
MEAHGTRTPCANSATKSAESVAAPYSARLTLPCGLIRWAELFAAPFSALAEYATHRAGVKLRTTMVHAAHTTSITRPIADVFGFFADATNDPRWPPGVLKRVLES